MNETLERIVDGLAEQGYAVIDNFLEPEEVKAILVLDAFQDAAASFKKAGIGKNQDLQINEAIRGDYIQWIDRNTAPASVKVYLDKLQTLIQAVNRGLFLSLKDYEVHMTVYPPGSFYKRHLDQFKKDDHRKLSVICYLNEDWHEEHGGQLRMHLPNETVDFLPLAGRLVCFRSDQIEHEVIAATRERRSLTGWMLDQVAELRHL
ncbi:2OG-Fe(II) oxygenase [Fulvivirgaceae bacterium PWU5]|uniref:2OG-Fe(II) oxygenase n=1 Tax=Dawidia cretensis TaxID=2782350 RepID=A0AAP2DVD0_9BACT|nr:2OG-Fe(II) oxygenase [Dawidia cretensis]MBT1706837.1 2OG-Fe(II) oxygenase [Dawidia cretensis]